MFTKGTILYGKQEVEIPSPTGRGKGMTVKRGQEFEVISTEKEQQRSYAVTIRRRNGTSTQGYQVNLNHVKKYFAYEGSK